MIVNICLLILKMTGSSRTLTEKVATTVSNQNCRCDNRVSLVLWCYVARVSLVLWCYIARVSLVLWCYVARVSYVNLVCFLGPRSMKCFHAQMSSCARLVTESIPFQPSDKATVATT